MVDDREPRVTTDEVRGGSTTGIVRIVLVASLVLVIVAFAILLFIYR